MGPSSLGKRTHTCGALRGADVGQEVVLMGWVDRRRDHGGLIFVNLRDRYGVTQAVVDEESPAEVQKAVDPVRPEFVVAVKGTVANRGEGNVNPDQDTGEIEVRVQALEILAESLVPPFTIHDEVKASEEMRMRYRYLDLRRPVMKANLLLRHKALQLSRTVLTENDFLELETPILTKSTPEGARDYLVPSRVHKGSFYALPQSPQIFKQICMVAGFDRYFQIVRCFRDEDLRADRQPEFTQIDMEMSFVDKEDVFAVTENLIASLFELVGPRPVTPFQRMTYREAMDRYGTDRPDLRLGMEIVDLSSGLGGTEFRVVTSALKKGGVVRGLRVPGGATFSRKQIDELETLVKDAGAGGLLWMKRESGGEIRCPVAKHLGEESVQSMIESLELEEGDLGLCVAADLSVTSNSLGAVRTELGRRLEIANRDDWRFCWVVDFPMFEYDENEGRHVAMHHPFTSPMEEDLEYLESDPGRVNARSYDLVWNGLELGGGSIRIHRPDIQRRVFTAMGIDNEEAQSRFGFFLDSLEYGAPPHGGIALGFDRIVMALAGEESLRQVIAFPKTTAATCLMTESPSPVDERQLEELQLKLRPGKSEKPEQG